MMRFLFYSHDGLGLGHTRRHLAVADALTELSSETSVLLATGADDVIHLALPKRVEILKLPGLRKVSNGEYSSRRLDIPAGEIRELRSDLLLATVKSFRPSVVLVDKHPFGAGGEFKSGLKALRRLGGRAVLGLRDILDEPARVVEEWKPYDMQRRIAKYYDRVLIYGRLSVFNPVEAYQFPAALIRRTQFCGYVVNRETAGEWGESTSPIPAQKGEPLPVVIATAGGGEDGFALLETFIRSSKGAPWLGIVVAGPMTPENDLQALQSLAKQNDVLVHTFVQHLSAMFGSVAALVCMGGYNTLAEAMSNGVPTVCVPRVAPRTEQLIRARAFETLGLLRAIHPDQLTPQILRDGITAGIAAPRQRLRAHAHEVLGFDGAHQAAKHLLELAKVDHATAAMT